MVTLESAKAYLRIDGDDEDETVLSPLLETAKRLVMDVARVDEKEMEDNKEVTDTAVKFALSYLYENRNTADHHHLNEMLRHQLFSLREGIM